MVDGVVVEKALKSFLPVEMKGEGEKCVPHPTGEDYDERRRTPNDATDEDEAKWPPTTT